MGYLNPEWQEQVTLLGSSLPSARPLNQLPPVVITVTDSRQRGKVGAPGPTLAIVYCDDGDSDDDADIYSPNPLPMFLK